MNIRLCFIVLTGCLLLTGVPSPLPAQEDRENSMPTAPVKRFVSDEAKQELFASIQQAERVFTGRIQAIILSPVAAISNPPVRITRITFDEIQMLKGERPYENTFLYPKSPESLDYSRGMRVIISLKHGNPHNGLKISGIGEASPANLAMAERAIASAPRDKTKV